MSESNALVEQILSGANPELQRLAASGMVPIAPEELIPVQVVLAETGPADVAAQARAALVESEVSLVTAFVRQQAGGRELRWFGRNVDHASVVEAVLRRSDVPRDLLVEMAVKLWPEAQETLLLRQDAILDEPQILVALEENRQLSSYAKRRIWEYREHLLPRDKVPHKKPEEILAEADAWTEEEIEEAIEEVRAKPIEGERIDELRGLTEGQIRGLPVPVRIRLARMADRQARSIFIRDNNPQVAMGVMLGNRMTDLEIEQAANSRAVHLDVLAEIPKRREWIRKYSIAKALVRNPRTHIAIAIRLLPRLTVNDLRALAREKGVSQAVRSQAQRLYVGKR